MKTPEEIKKGLECCHDDDACECEYCPYSTEGEETLNCDFLLREDALAYIQHLEAERDAAVNDMTEIVQESGEPYCEYCEWNGRKYCAGRCWIHNEGFKWRGVQKEE